MEEFIKILIGVIFLALGFPIGIFLAKKTKEELRGGQKWFRLLIIICLIGGVVSLILGNDALMFSFLFIAIVTSRSLNERRIKTKITKKGRYSKAL